MNIVGTMRWLGESDLMVGFFVLEWKMRELGVRLSKNGFRRKRLAGLFLQMLCFILAVQHLKHKAH